MSAQQGPFDLMEQQDYYEVLELKPDASPGDIREAYFRVKATYQKENVALYTLIGAAEREEMLRKVEEAYAVLSDPAARRDYDRHSGDLGEPPSNVISIDRHPPMDPFVSEQDPLVAPTTDFDFNPQPPVASETGSRAPVAPVSTPMAASAPGMAPALAEETPRVAAFPSRFSRVRASQLPIELEIEIRDQSEWSGAFLRRVREAHAISLEEVTQATKITKAYLIAIEEENYVKLPAPVFVRGFVSQIARLLKLPHQEVAASYMARFRRIIPDKAG